MKNLLAAITVALLAVSHANDILNNVMPCCLESLGISACARLKRRSGWFEERCQKDADFGIIQCCHTCGTNVAQVGLKLFSEGAKSRQCFDRHGNDFCISFLRVHRDGRNKCSGADAALAFRLCRKTCGFCDRNVYLEQKTDPQCPLIG